MADLVRVRVGSRDGVQIASIAGEVDISSVGDVRGALTRALDAESRGLVVDLTGARYLDSAAISLLFDFAERLRRRGKPMRLVLAEGALMRKTLLLTGVDRVTPVDPDVDAAVEALR